MMTPVSNASSACMVHPSGSGTVWVWTSCPCAMTNLGGSSSVGEIFCGRDQIEVIHGFSQTAKNKKFYTSPSLNLLKVT